MPITSRVSTWGNEIYFKTPLKITEGTPTSDLNIGNIAYWPTGQCICVFFGPTPMSTGLKPVPVSDVFVVGKTKCTPEELRKVESHSFITEANHASTR